MVFGASSVEPDYTACLQFVKHYPPSFRLALNGGACITHACVGRACRMSGAGMGIQQSRPTPPASRSATTRAGQREDRPRVQA